MSWCVVQIKSQQEKIALTNLNQQGFKTFMPLLREHRGREVNVVPMFSRYLFVELFTRDQEERWQLINSTRGVSRILTNSRLRPSLLPIGWVESMIEKGEIMDRFEDATSFSLGDELEFINGPFKGHRGKCQWTGRDRVALLLSLLGRDTMVYSNSLALKRALNSNAAVVR